MMMRLLSLACILAFLGFVQAADTHHNGHKQITGKGNGTHQIYNGKNGHMAHATVKNGKVTEVKATHKGKNLKVSKYKTAKKRHALLELQSKTQVVMAGSAETVHHLVAAEANEATLFVGFGYINAITGQLVIFWFPITIVDGGDAGCINYDSACD